MLQLRVAYPSVLCASLALAGPGHAQVVRVIVDSYDKAAELDAWSSSSNQVGAAGGASRLGAVTWWMSKIAACPAGVMD